MPRAEPRIHFVAFDQGGAGRIRSYYPARALRELGWNVTAWDRSNYPQPGTVDVLIVHRPSFEQQDLRDAHRDAGAIVLIQEDDDLRSIPSTFPEWRSEIMTLQEWRELHEYAIMKADGLIASTQQLLDVYGSLAKRTWIADNYLPAWIQDCRWYKHPDAGEPIRVGWAGIVATHKHDLLWIKPHIARACQGATFCTVGDWRTLLTLGNDSFLEYENDDYEWDEAAFYKLMAKADIGIVPLDPDELINHSKSYLKSLEYHMLGKPTVVVDIPEQLVVVVPGETGLVASTPEEFADHVQRLVHDHALRERMGRMARLRSNDFLIETNAQNIWGSILEECLSYLPVSG